MEPYRGPSSKVLFNLEIVLKMRPMFFKLSLKTIWNYETLWGRAMLWMAVPSHGWYVLFILETSFFLEIHVKILKFVHILMFS